MVFDYIIDTVGNTPIIRLHSFDNRKGNYFAKMETFNPGSSSKDRIALNLIEQAENDGVLKPGGTIIEATSGNTGLGLALAAKKKGYKVILVMPDKMSPDKMNLVKAVGCEVIVCPTEVEPDDPRSYYSISKKIASETDNSFYANQYHNKANPDAHYKGTGPEIWAQTDGKITHFIAGVGTGGTISGTAKFLKEKNPKIKIIAIDPVGSILAHYHKYKNTDIEAKGYKVEGVGEDIIPKNVYFDLIDDFVKVTDEESFKWSRKIASEEGIVVGGSSGMAVAGAYKYSKIIQDDNAFVVMVLPDTGERYLNRVFSDSWMKANGFLPKPNSIKELLSSKSAQLPELIEIQDKDTIEFAWVKLSKFQIKYVLVKNNNGFQLLNRRMLQEVILNGMELSKPVSSLKLLSIPSIDVGKPISELINSLQVSSPILISESNEIIGILTLGDIFNNFPLNVLQS